MQDTIVLYPFPHAGHIRTMVELGKLILNHHDKFSITILLTSGYFDTPSTSSYLHHISLTYPSISFHLFPTISVDSTAIRPRSHLAVAFEFIRLSTVHVLPSLKEISKTCNICGFVVDIFCTLAIPVAKSLGIPTYCFFTSGAACLSAFMYIPMLHQQYTESIKDLTSTILKFPGLPSIKAIHMPEPLLDRKDPSYDDFVCFCSHLSKPDGIIVNTFEDLEPNAVKILQDGSCAPGIPIPPVYHIGPLISLEKDQATKEDSEAEEDYVSWLDKQPKRSVIFLCFGSRGSFSVEQVHEIAEGLEGSGYRFLWVLKSPTSNKTNQTKDTIEFELEAVLPEGFLERTKDRGRVVKSWAPQVVMLSKESVGAFVTHCGWNSVLEAVVTGVPVVTWPLYAEQHMNKVFLVEDMKMAFPLEEREDGIVSADALKKCLTELMESETGRRFRAKSEKMREMALAAWSETGSSTRALAKLVETWKKT